MLIYCCHMETIFSDWLKEMMAKAGITQAELARRSTISPGHITKILNGQRGVGEQSLKMIADALGIPAEEAYRAVGLLPQTSEHNAELERLEFIYNKLSADRKKDLLDFADYLLSK